MRQNVNADGARTAINLIETAMKIKKYYKVKLTNSNRTMGRRMLLLLSLLWLWLLHCSCRWYGSQDCTDCNQAKSGQRSSSGRDDRRRRHGEKEIKSRAEEGGSN